MPGRRMASSPSVTASPGQGSLICRCRFRSQNRQTQRKLDEISVAAPLPFSSLAMILPTPEGCATLAQTLPAVLLTLVPRESSGGLALEGLGGDAGALGHPHQLGH